jgi:hypothetical protein
MIHILNKLTSDYDLQLALMERRVGDATVEEVRGDLNLRFERLNMRSFQKMMKMKSWKKKLYSVGNLKKNNEIVGKLGTSHFSAKNNSNHNGGNNGHGTRTRANCFYTVANRAWQEELLQTQEEGSAKWPCQKL